MAKNRYREHYCWVCGRMRANDRFSGRGYARHVCKDCAPLGKKELAYRQEVHNLERLLDFDGRVRRKRREQFQRYLTHENERVRAYACEIEIADAIARAEDRADYELDDVLLEFQVEGVHLFKSVPYAGDVEDDLDLTTPAPQ
jgi:hypothetical protein